MLRRAYALVLSVVIGALAVLVLWAHLVIAHDMNRAAETLLLTAAAPAGWYGRSTVGQRRRSSSPRWLRRR